MVNRKGYIKTIEAVIAIILLLIFVYNFVPRNGVVEPTTPFIVDSAQKIIVKEIMQNETIRSGIIDSGITDCRTYTKLNEGIIKKHLPGGYSFTCEICDTPVCISNLTPVDKSVYMTDAFISATQTNQNPKILRIWIWEG
ncbi:hypothetical protein HYX19_03065 [Candidatus Woesearchaeota archaeon]|nr:hypothetical protein [Candidatus Woesearchaeota archaeon]